MDPLAQFCHNPDCPARGQVRRGNIRVHSRKECRYRCSTCGQTFIATHDTPFYRLRRSVDLVTIVITLLCHGCPVQAIVVAFELGERTVADGRDRAGRHGQRLHGSVWCYRPQTGGPHGLTGKPSASAGDRFPGSLSTPAR
jgi:transposase-like protein